MNTDIWQEDDKKYIWHPATQMKDAESFAFPVIERGKGPYLYDRVGKEYIDIISSWWCNLLGHCNAEINAAVKKQLDTLEHVIFASFTHRPAISLCRELTPLLPPGLQRYNFCDNGSSAVECALKMAFQYHCQTGHPERQRFMCLAGSYHGETIGALAVGSMDLYARLYRPLLTEAIHIDGLDCYRCPYGEQRDSCNCACIEHAEAAFARYGNVTAALIIEPLLQGAAGMRIYPPAYITKLRRLCDAYGVLLIDDEIAAGFGRTGTYFAIEQSRVSPDILCTSKGLTGGYLPMSLTITTEAVYRAFYDDYETHKAFVHSHTYAGNPLGCTAATTVLRILQRDAVLETASATGTYLHAQLQASLGNHSHIGEIRHIALINALEIVASKDEKKPYPPSRRIGFQIARQAMKRGLLLRPIGDVIYFNPPLNIDRTTLDQAVAICTDAVHAVLGYR
ncbi:adenosylmethionine--8-amino-7-oxononanoate transaminase [Megasphaera vaginalis (ex Srinivasan et al. 2021)]|uniref:Adenosylmethionine-8-amino-7-oxononanoate aminotransferase n=1 Tax=Megasphaera vaginalis (ex Srinivasan et al. 2021) TaxID=1111454 RepID=U7URD6_9FIRM|nr:adenosylmethionine--8-amino-7-oxononanoate transaminase [Megasphaera vaginalis (ex Srinivasan et al. 2021)]ERT61890.1 adenosylmethionine-8-amino-7-oxononanoate transaminase [Megasphaera vaginalis (ex Srinivasan et al. 2021)]